MNFTGWNVWIERRMFMLALVGLVAGYLFPQANSSYLRGCAVLFFAYATFVMSMSASFRHFLGVLKQPLIPLWILFLTHVCTPLLAWGIGMLAYPDDPQIRLGYLIASSVPIGVSSLVWTALTGGNLAISLVAVSLDTIIVPVLLPSFFKLIIGKAIAIDYLKMALQLMAMVTLPSVLGMIWHDRATSQATAFTRGIGGFSAKMCLVAVIYLNSAVVVSGAAWSPALLKAAAVTLVLVLMGYLVGFCASFALRDRSMPMTLTLMYGVGLRNVSVGLVLALSYFPPAVAIPITLYILFQQPLAALIPRLVERLSA